MGFATKINESEDASGINQSAFKVICNKLMATPQVAEQKTETIDIEQLADLIVGKMKVAEPQKHKEPIKESAWDSFFNGGK